MAALLRVLAMLLLVVATGAARAEELPAWVGARAETVNPQVMAARGLSVPFGAMLGDVTPGGAADKAGLKAEDTIIFAAGQPLVDAAGLARLLADMAPGARLDVNRVRKGEAPATVALQRPLPPPRSRPLVSGAAPRLMLDTGGHMALIKGLTFTADGRYIVSGSEDKVVRVWDVETGKTVRTFRGEAGPGSEGKIFALALSPDGRWLAVGGWFAKSDAMTPCCGDVRLYDFATGALVALLKGHTSVVNSLAFSADGRRMISGSSDNTAIVWDLSRTSDPSRVRLTGHSDRVQAVGLAPDGTYAVTGGDDAAVKVWRVADGALIGEMKGHANRVLAVSIHRNGQIASGTYDGEIRMLELPAEVAAAAKGGAGQDGARRPVEITSRVLVNSSTRVGTLAFHPDGGKLLASCSQRCRGAYGYVYEVATGRELAAYRGHDNVVIAAAISPDGRWVATGGGANNDIHIWELATGQRRKAADGAPLSLGGSGAASWAAGFAKDGTRIAWGTTSAHKAHNDRGPLERSLRLPLAGASLGRPEGIAAAAPGGPPQRAGAQGGASREDFARAFDTHGTVSLAHRKGGTFGYDAILDIRRDGKAAASIERGSTDGYGHFSYSMTPGGQSLVSSGANGQIYAHDLSGKRIGEFRGHDSVVWAVAPSTDGRYLVSSSDDQTVRLWNLATREPLVTLFNGRDGEWVMWTEQGFYTGSTGGGALVGWQINRGPAQAAQYVTGEQLRKTLNRPDIIERAIQLASADAAVKEAKSKGSLAADFSLAELLSQRPPELRIAAPRPGPKGETPTVSGGRATLVLHVAQGELPVDAIEVFVRDQKVPAERVGLPANAPRAPAGFEAQAYEVALFGGDNDIAVVASNAAGSTPPRGHVVRVTHNGEGALDRFGTLHIVAVGVDRYPGLGNTCGEDGRKSCHLRFAGKDAKAFAEAAQREMGPLHQTVAARVLVSGAGGRNEPTRVNIEAAMRALEGARENDTVVVFLAGHGERGEGSRYHFLPTDIAGRGIEDAGKGQNLIDWTAIQTPIEKALGRRLMFVDACQSGQAQAARGYNDRLLGDARASRFSVFMAAGPDQLAEEHDSVGHGFFTYALVQGLTGKALDPRERTVRASGLGTFVAREVRALSSGRQQPEFSPAGDVVLARR